MTNITAVMIAQDESHYIERAINNVKPYVDEVIVVDGGSIDTTVVLAQALGARVIEHPFDNHRDQKNRAIEAVKTEWVLLLDCDEYFEQTLLDRLQDLIHNDQGIDAYDFPRKLLLGGQVAGDYPDMQTRLFRNYVRHCGHPHHHWAKDNSKKSLFVPDIHIIHEKSLYDQQKDNELYFKTDPQVYKVPPLMRYIPMVPLSDLPMDDTTGKSSWVSAEVAQNDYLRGALWYFAVGQGITRHKHASKLEIWFIVSGELIVEFNERDVLRYSGPAVALILPGVTHACRAESYNGVAVFVWKSEEDADPPLGRVEISMKLIRSQILDALLAVNGECQ